MLQFMTDDQTPVFYYDSGGDKPPVVFIHGWTSSSRDWRGIMGRLVKQYRCIAINLRGHGKTPAKPPLTISRLAQDVHQLIQHLELKQPTLVGWSMGGLTTFEYLHQFGYAHLNSVVLVDQTPRMRTDETWELGLFGEYTHVQVSEIKDLLSSQKNRVIRQFSKEILHPKRHTLRFLSWMVAPYRGKYNVEALIALSDDMADCDYRELVPTINLPVLLCYGAASWLYPGAVGEYLHEHLPQAQLVKFSKSGHCPPIEEPRKFVRTLRTFLDQQHVSSSVVASVDTQEQSA